MNLQGKGIFIWRIPACEGGNIADIAAMVHDADLGHVLIKVADGAEDYNFDPDTGEDLTPPLIQALRAQIPGIGVWAWHFVYGYDPEDEAVTALERMNELDIDGYVINAESAYKNRHAQAREFMELLTSAANVPLALSSYRYPSLHRELPWDEFLSGMDVMMPQVYWIHADNPKEQLNWSIEEFAALYAQLGYSVPIFPTGAAFSEHGWTATAVEVLEFMEEARRLELSGCNFWEYAEARHDNPELWQAIASYDWPWDGDDDGFDLDPPVPEEPVAPEPGAYMEVIVPTLNIRAGPGVMYEDLGDLHEGDIVDIREVRGEDVWVRIGPGKWAAAWFNNQQLMEVADKS